MSSLSYIGVNQVIYDQFHLLCWCVYDYDDDDDDEADDTAADADDAYDPKQLSLSKQRGMSFRYTSTTRINFSQKCVSSDCFVIVSLYAINRLERRPFYY